jgi:hypothetical protein
MPDLAAAAAVGPITSRSMIIRGADWVMAVLLDEQTTIERIDDHCAQSRFRPHVLSLPFCALALVSQLHSIIANHSGAERTSISREGDAHDLVAWSCSAGGDGRVDPQRGGGGVRSERGG